MTERHECQEKSENYRRILKINLAESVNWLKCGGSGQKIGKASPQYSAIRNQFFQFIALLGAHANADHLRRQLALCDRNGRKDSTVVAREKGNSGRTGQGRIDIYAQRRCRLFKGNRGDAKTNAGPSTQIGAKSAPILAQDDRLLWSRKLLSLIFQRLMPPAFRAARRASQPRARPCGSLLRARESCEQWEWRG